MIYMRDLLEFLNWLRVKVKGTDIIAALKDGIVEENSMAKKYI